MVSRSEMFIWQSCGVGPTRNHSFPSTHARLSWVLFVWLISHQPVVLFSQNKSATSNQPTVLFSQNKSAPATSQTNRLISSEHLELEGISPFLSHARRRKATTTASIHRPATVGLLLPLPLSPYLTLGSLSLSFFDGCGVCGRADGEVVSGRGLARLAPSVGRLRPRRPAPPRLHQLPVLHRVCMTTRLRSPPPVGVPRLQ
jgi:hypothetical protein